jgi:hypothetical protein
MSYASNVLLDTIFVRFLNKVFRQIVRSQMATNSFLFVADLFLYCNKSQFMTDKLQKDPSEQDPYVE